MSMFDKLRSRKNNTGENNTGKYWEQWQILNPEVMNSSGSSKEQMGQTSFVKKINETESTEIMYHTLIDGDQYINNGQILNPAFLKQDGFAPQYKINLDGRKISFSHTYTIGSYEAIMAYIQTDDNKYKCRSYYKSRSAGVWRYLPDYATRPNGSIWYGKAYNEESLTLPFEIQASLEDIRQEGIMQFQDNGIPEFAFFGTAKYYKYEEYNKDKKRGDFYTETKSEPIPEFYDSHQTKFLNPETLQLSGDKAPDFNKQTAEFSMNAGVSGECIANVFDSKDETLSYIFLTDAKGRSCLSSIQTKSKITSCGTREEWVIGGNYTTPLYEYSTQDGGYGDQFDRPLNQDYYVGMWQNYLSRTPYIQEYQKAIGLSSQL